ncbi:unnamed protein product [Nesidiocoris tenuis]|uniref:Uncharacterized protein n=1 Tax=Nesidiocoris tenuis TaxID=355587 RepID=A0A6H5G9A0_9HEMI|nr:unnamed protein product [Nesidiocoris tenuis]
MVKRRNYRKPDAVKRTGTSRLDNTRRFREGMLKFREKSFLDRFGCYSDRSRMRSGISENVMNTDGTQSLGFHDTRQGPNALPPCSQPAYLTKPVKYIFRDQERSNRSIFVTRKKYNEPVVRK